MSKPKTDREKAFLDGGDSEYLWCLHCERAYKNGEYRQEGDLQMCPYDDCSGDTVIDAWDWETFAIQHHGYPEVPEIGKVYPLYL